MRPSPAWLQDLKRNIYNNSKHVISVPVFSPIAALLFSKNIYGNVRRYDKLIILFGHNLFCFWWKIFLKILKISIELFLLFRVFYQELTKDQQESSNSD